MSRTSYTAEQKEAALALYVEAGPAEASKQTGVPIGTVSQWARRADAHSGVTQASRRARVQAATEASKLSRQERKARLADNLLADAERLRAQLWERAQVQHWGQTSVKEGSTVTTNTEFMEHEIDQPVFGDKRSILQAIAVAVDKSQLLAGEATSRSEQVSVTELEKALNDAIPDPEQRRRLALRVLPGDVEGVG